MDGKGINLKLPEELTLFTVDDFRTSIIEKLGNKKVATLDGADLSLLDGAGIQLLLSIYKSFPHLIIVNLSEDIVENLELMGVKEILIGDGSVENG